MSSQRTSTALSSSMFARDQEVQAWLDTLSVSDRADALAAMESTMRDLDRDESVVIPLYSRMPIRVSDMSSEQYRAWYESLDSEMRDRHPSWQPPHMMYTRQQDADGTRMDAYSLSSDTSTPYHEPVTAPDAPCPLHMNRKSTSVPEYIMVAGQKQDVTCTCTTTGKVCRMRQFHAIDKNGNVKSTCAYCIGVKHDPTACKLSKMCKACSRHAASVKQAGKKSHSSPYWQCGCQARKQCVTCVDCMRAGRMCYSCYVHATSTSIALSYQHTQVDYARMHAAMMTDDQSAESASQRMAGIMIDTVTKRVFNQSWDASILDTAMPACTESSLPYIRHADTMAICTDKGVTIGIRSLTTKKAYMYADYTDGRKGVHTAIHTTEHSAMGVYVRSCSQCWMSDGISTRNKCKVCRSEAVAKAVIDCTNGYHDRRTEWHAACQAGNGSDGTLKACESCQRRAESEYHKQNLHLTSSGRSLPVELDVTRKRITIDRAGKRVRIDSGVPVRVGGMAGQMVRYQARGDAATTYSIECGDVPVKHSTEFQVPFPESKYTPEAILQQCVDSQRKNGGPCQHCVNYRTRELIGIRQSMGGAIVSINRVISAESSNGAEIQDALAVPEQVTSISRQYCEHYSREAWEQASQRAASWLNTNCKCHTGMIWTAAKLDIRTLLPIMLAYTCQHTSVLCQLVEDASVRGIIPAYNEQHAGNVTSSRRASIGKIESAIVTGTLTQRQATQANYRASAKAKKQASTVTPITTYITTQDAATGMYSIVRA